MKSELCVLGCTAGSPSALGPASGYLVSAGDTSVLVDCGPGVIAAAAERGALEDLDAVVVTHEHLDHCGDLMALGFNQAFPRRRRPLSLYAPASLARVLASLDETFGIATLPDLAAPLREQLRFRPVEPGDSFDIGDLRVDTLLAAHPVPTISLRFPDLDVVYTADTALTAALVDFCADVGTLVAEATYVSADGHDFEAHGHMAGAEAGLLAKRSAVDHLVVTHLADPRDAPATIAEVRRHYAGTVEAAAPGLTLGNGPARKRAGGVPHGQ